MITNQNVDPQDKTIKLLCGLLYLIIIAAGIFAEVFVRSKLTVSDNADATAASILASSQLWRTGFVAELVMLTCDVAVAVLLYKLLRPVNRDIALLAAFFRLVSDAISATNELNHFSAMFTLGDAPYLSAFTPQQLHTLTYLSIKSFSHGYNISLVFFGACCACLGYLVIKSGSIPRYIGILLLIASACYLTNSFAWFLAPGFAGMLFPDDIDTLLYCRTCALPLADCKRSTQITNR